MMACQNFRLPEESIFLKSYIKNNLKLMLVINCPKGQHFSQRVKIIETKWPLVKNTSYVSDVVLGILTNVPFLINLST